MVTILIFWVSLGGRYQESMLLATTHWWKHCWLKNINYVGYTDSISFPPFFLSFSDSCLLWSNHLEFFLVRKPTRRIWLLFNQHFKQRRSWKRRWHTADGWDSLGFGEEKMYYNRKNVSVTNLSLIGLTKVELDIVNKNFAWINSS